MKGESARCPGKNLRPMGPGSWPMFLRTVQAARECGGSVALATDSKDAQTWAPCAAGCPVLLRPPALSEPDVSAVSVVLWAMDILGVPDDDEHAVGMLLPTSPLRTAATIRRCMELWGRDPCASVATVREVHKGALRYDTSSGWLAKLGPPRSPAEPYAAGWPPSPSVYVSTGGCQIASARTLRAQGRYWVPKTRPVVVDAVEGLDVDTEADFALADAWLWRNSYRIGQVTEAARTTEDP